MHLTGSVLAIERHPRFEVRQKGAQRSRIGTRSRVVLASLSSIRLPVQRPPMISATMVTPFRRRHQISAACCFLILESWVRPPAEAP